MLLYSDVLRKCRNAAKLKGGVCTSLFRKKRQWFARCRCKMGHLWSQRAYYISRGQWCWDCAHHSENATPAAMHSLAESRGGKFLSKNWKGTGVKHRWKCGLGHTWHAKPNSITQGRWCPECSGRLSERICRTYFETIFRSRFPPAWPKWLTNSRGHFMELDGYSKRLSLAFEFQGIQHYKSTRIFHKGNRDVQLQRLDDARKRRLCQTNGVRLFLVPYTLQHKRYPEFILAACRRLGIKVPTVSRNFKVDLRKTFSPDALEQLRSIAQRRGGTLLADTYLGSNKPIPWSCVKGHAWAATPSSIKMGSWCPVCSKKSKWSLVDIGAWATENGLQCLSKRYTHNRQRLEWACPKGHVWHAQWNSVRIGSRCPDCAGTRKKTIGEVRALAKQRGWTCLSKRYIGANEVLRFRCSRGHAIGKTWTQLRLGITCGTCFGHKNRSKAAERRWAKRRATINE